MPSLVLIVDDDLSFRRSTERLIRSAGFKVQTFASATEFLSYQLPDVPACLVLDIRLPGLNGLDLQQRLAKAGSDIPIIFMTGHGDVPTSVRAMKAGAVEFLTKPFRDQDLLEAIQEAIIWARRARDRRTRLAELRARYELLTARECQVMEGVVAGLLNKQVASELGTTEKTIKFHRGNMMHKMKAESVADLVRMAADLEAPLNRSASRG